MPQSPMCGPRGSYQLHLTSFSSLRPHYHPVLPLKNLLFFHTVLSSPLDGLSFSFPILNPIEATIIMYIVYTLRIGHQMWCTDQTPEFLEKSFEKMILMLWSPIVVYRSNLRTFE